jgi:hypothetical protein
MDQTIVKTLADFVGLAVAGVPVGIVIFVIVSALKVLGLVDADAASQRAAVVVAIILAFGVTWYNLPVSFSDWTARDVFAIGLTTLSGCLFAALSYQLWKKGVEVVMVGYSALLDKLNGVR